MCRLQNRRRDERSRYGAHLIERLVKGKALAAAHARSRMREHGITRRRTQRLAKALEHDEKRDTQHTSRKSHGGNSEPRRRVTQNSEEPIATGTIGSRPARQAPCQRSRLTQARGQTHDRRRGAHRVHQRTLNRKRRLVHDVHEHAHDAKAQDKPHRACRACLRFP